MAKKIIMVCLGNICRSPLAEGILKSKIKNPEIIVDSAGTASYHLGEHPDERAILTARKNGIDISKHIGRQLKSQDINYYDIIYVMDDFNYRDVIRMCRNDEERQRIVFISENLFPGMKIPVPDPYYGTMADFEKSFSFLNECCSKIAENIH